MSSDRTLAQSLGGIMFAFFPKLQSDARWLGCVLSVFQAMNSSRRLPFSCQGFG